jgi:ubiquinone/menaquinone biosynthesis C-methylase UbiE
MTEIKLTPISVQNGVYILSNIDTEFETTYIKVRQKEDRIYSDDELKNLPFASETNPHKMEWKLRANSFLRFKRYLKSGNKVKKILDLGCGNGWFCGQLSKSFNHDYYCFDINLTELKQGRRIFISEKMKFIYADIFDLVLPNNSFDIIIINAAIQYFQDLKKLLLKLLTILNDRGEIHIIDSPIYSDTDAINAKQRTKDYYSAMGFTEMIENYHHHTWKEFNDVNYKVLYNPRSAINMLKKIIVSDSPFPWIKVSK